MKVEELLTKYPRLLGDLPYIAVGEGWYELLDRLCRVLEHHTKHSKIDVKAVQVKEKFGGLRIYVDGSDDYVLGAIALAETMSYSICEVCGKPGAPNSTGWIRTLCDEHRKPAGDETKG